MPSTPVHTSLHICVHQVPTTSWLSTRSSASCAYSSAWVTFLTGRVQPSLTPAPYKARSDWPVMPWLALSFLPHCAQEQWVRGIMMPVVLCRRDPEGPPSLFGVTGVSPVSVHPLTAPGGHETGEESSLPVSRIKGACGSLGWLCEPLWGFLQPSPPLTKGLPTLTQHLAGCSLLELSVAQSPTTPTAGGEPTLSFISPPALPPCCRLR